jgi:hypothetical protein
MNQDRDNFRRALDAHQKREAEQAQVKIRTPEGFQPRVLTQPPSRQPFPSYFIPDVLGPGASPHRHVHDALIAAGENPAEIKRINIAYPHKHPGLFPGHLNKAENFVREVENFLQIMWRREGYGTMNFVRADAICENAHLNRKWKKGAVYSLTAKQEYSLCMDLQNEHLPFLDPVNTQKEYFVIADHTVETGTTLANLASFIQWNGGHVLGVMIGIPTEGADYHFLQNDLIARPKILKSPFNDSSRNAAALPVLAQAFFESARKHGQSYASPHACMQRFEQALNKAGHSVFTLTQGECKRILQDIRGKGQVFTEGNSTPRKAPAVPFHRMVAQIEARF